MILLCDFINHYIQQYYTKFTNFTYLLLYSYLLIFSIYQILSIYYWELAFLYHIIEKYTSYYLIY